MAASASSTEEGRLAHPRRFFIPVLFFHRLVLTVCLVCITATTVFILQGFNQDIPEKLLLADPILPVFISSRIAEGDNHMHCSGWDSKGRGS